MTADSSPVVQAIARLEKAAKVASTGHGSREDATRLVLSGVHTWSLADMGALRACFKQHVVEKLVFTACTFDDASGLLWSSIPTRASGVQSVRLFPCTFRGSYAALDMLEALSQLEHLQELYLEGPIGFSSDTGDTGHAIASLLTTRAVTLQVFRFKCFDLSRADKLAFAYHFAHGNTSTSCSLQVLELPFCKLGDDGLEALLRMLSHANRMRKLDLKGNRLTGDSLPHLFAFLKESANSLEVLNLHNNPSLLEASDPDGEEDRSEFRHALRNCRTLSSLRLSSCGMDAYFVTRMLSRRLAVSLVDLDLGTTRMNHDALAALWLDSSRYWKHLRSLHFAEWSHLSHEVVQIVVNVLQSHRILQSLGNLPRNRPDFFTVTLLLTRNRRMEQVHTLLAQGSPSPALAAAALARLAADGEAGLAGRHLVLNAMVHLFGPKMATDPVV